MAGPQKENGYTPVANEIMEAVARLQINATQFRVLMVVWRYTYGFSRKEHKLSEGFIAEATGIHKKQVGRELVQLIKRNILNEVVPPSFSTTRVIAFNKHYDTWIVDSQPNSRQSTKPLTGSETVDQTVNGSVDTPFSQSGPPIPHKPNSGGDDQWVSTNPLTVNGSVDQDKQDIKQNLKQGDAAVKKEANALFDHLWQLYPRKKGKGKVTDTQKKKLLKVGREQLERCIDRFKADMDKEGRPMDKQPYGSTFFNSGYIDYLDENFNAADMFEGIPTEHLDKEQRRLRGY